MLRKDAKIELLKNVPLFSQCEKKQLASSASLADLISVPAGTQLITEGRPGLAFLMVIIKGGGEVRRKGRKIDTLAPGDFIGEMALITGGMPRNATVRTTTDTSLLAVTGARFLGHCSSRRPGFNECTQGDGPAAAVSRSLRHHLRRRVCLLRSRGTPG